MAWKRGDVVWSNMTLRELILAILSACFVVGVFAWVLLGIVLTPSSSVHVTAADTIVVLICCVLVAALVTRFLDRL